MGPKSLLPVLYINHKDLDGVLLVLQSVILKVLIRYASGVTNAVENLMHAVTALSIDVYVRFIWYLDFQHLLIFIK